MELDTQAGYVRYTLAEPERIDFAAIEEAAHDAGYTLTELKLELEGEVFGARCEVCADEVTMLRVSETGQQLELNGDVPHGKTIRLEASVSGWASSHARLTVLEWREVGAPGSAQPLAPLLDPQ